MPIELYKNYDEINDYFDLEDRLAPKIGLFSLF